MNPITFLGDAAFDYTLLCKELLTGDTFGKEKHFSKAYIPLNSRSKLKILTVQLIKMVFPVVHTIPHFQRNMNALLN